MDKAIVSQYLYNEYCKEYSGAKEWGKPPYKEWLEQKLFDAQTKSQESDSLPPVSDLFVLLNEIDGDEYYWNGKEWADSKDGCPSYEYEKAVEYSGVFGCRFTDAE